MKYNHKCHIILIACTAILFSACSIWSPRQWEKLEDRKFYFNKFTYICKGVDTKTAYDFMQQFPLSEMLRIISGRFNIEIDFAEFEAFIAARDISRISAFGIILNDKFYWKGAAPKPNEIEFEYTNQFLTDSTDIERSYALVIKVNGSVRAIYTDTVKDKEDVIKSIALKAGR